MLPRLWLSARQLRVSCALALLATLATPSLLVPAASGWTTAGGVPAVLAQDAVTDQATLETRQPEVQWSPGGSDAWQSVPARQTVAAGDRVRTGSGASARLIYFEGTVTEIGADTGLLVQRLEHSPDGNIVTRLFQSAGTTVNRVVHLADPAASFEIETPAATAFVRGTTPQVQVGFDGTTRVSNVPDNTGGTVRVQGKDAGATEVILQPGEETFVQPGQPPSSPTPISGQQSQQPANPETQQAQQQQQQVLQMQQASAMMAGQGIAASFAAAQAGFANAVAAQQLQNQLLNQLTSVPSFNFSNFPVATGTGRSR
ncbi:MAG TPA: FecR domain-containing protein [Chloroflexota bacterium]|nr:FecR domain-containing protein [Chloroflexota bacterium]